ncbi:MAG TPA: MazG family protein [Mycobacteriales bacterium]|nr:MazG family protein [Mycobacteriales bacterium]
MADPAGTRPDRLLLLAWSPRLPAGLLSWAGWAALRAGPVYTADPDSAQAAAVRAAGIDVHPMIDPDAVRADAEPADAGWADARRAEAEPAEAEPAEAGRAEAGRADVGRGEAGPAGAGLAEAGRVEAGRVEAGRSEAGPSEAERSEAGRVEVGPAGAGLAGAARAFRELARGGRTVVWLAGPDGDPVFARALGDLVAREPVGSAEVEVVYGSWDPPGARLLDVVAVMDRLRSPGGCPWDAEQTHATLAPYLLEEAYELLDAIEGEDLQLVREELGDVLLQVAFHARLAEELPADERWSIDDVAGDLVAKLIRRHPHVFAEHAVSGVAEVEANWDAIKAAEKGRSSVLDGVPLGQPALSLAAKLIGRVEKAGLAVTAPAGDDLGSRLFALVAQARAAGVDPEGALRAVVREYRDAVRAAEQTRRAARP